MPDDEMPERPQTHVLGSKAVRALVNALPAAWVVREPGDDYGIDAEIEIFTGGRATGLTFKAQSKGTDTPGAVTRKVKRKTLNYWLKLDVPVLIALWDSSRDRLLYRWAHTLGSERPLPADTHKIAVRFDPANEVTPDWATTLPDYLDSYRSLKLGYLPFPLPISLQIDDDAGVDGPAVRAELQRILSHAGAPAPFVLRLTSPDTVRLRIEKNRLSARMPLDIASSAIKHPRGLSGVPQQHAMDMLVLAATGMAPVSGEIASHLARAGSPFSQQWRQPETAERMASILAHPDNTHLASWVLQILHDDEAAAYAFDLYFIAADRSLKFMADQDFDRMSASMRDDLDTAAALAADLADTDQRLRTNSNLGRRYFNLANMHKRRRSIDQALDCLTLAVALEPRYDTAAHFHGVLAEIQWYRKDFAAAQQAYGRAVDLGHDDPQRMRVLHVDALLRAGAFDEAASDLATWSPTSQWHDRVAIIDKQVLSTIRDQTALGSQERNPLTEQEWNDLTENGSRYLTADEALEILRDRDATDPHLWVVIAAHADLASSFPALLVAASMTESDVRLWASAAIAAIESRQDDQLVEAIVDAALFETAGSFYDALAHWASLPEETDPSDIDDQRGNTTHPDPGTALPDGTPALRIDVREVREHASRLLNLTRTRLELIPQLGLGTTPRLLSSDDPLAPLLHTEAE